MIYTKKVSIPNCEKYAPYTIAEVYKVEMVDALVQVEGEICRIDEMIDQRGLRVLMFFIQDDTGIIEVDYQVREDVEIEIFNEFCIGDTVIVYGSMMDDLFREEYRIYANEIIKDRVNN